MINADPAGYRPGVPGYVPFGQILRSVAGSFGTLVLRELSYGENTKMNYLKAEIYEKLGKRLNKAMILRRVEGPVDQAHYVLVATRFFNADEKFWKMDDRHAYELHLENESYTRGQTHVQFLDFESGNPIMMGPGAQVVYPPHVLIRMLGAEHVRIAVSASVGSAGNLLILGACVGVGVLIGFIVGQFVPMPGSVPVQPPPTAGV